MPVEPLASIWLFATVIWRCLDLARRFHVATTMPNTLSPLGMEIVLPLMSLGLSRPMTLMPMGVPETVLLSNRGRHARDVEGVEIDAHGGVGIRRIGCGGDVRHLVVADLAAGPQQA